MAKALRHLDQYIEIYVASLFLIIFSSLTILQVFMRYVLNNPLSWSEELARYAFIWFVYISGSYAVKFQRHVRLTFIVNNLPRPINLFFQLIALLFWLAFLIFLDIYSIEAIRFLYHSGQASSANNIPMYILYLSVALGAILMTVRVLQHIINKVKDIKRYFVNA